MEEEERSRLEHQVVEIHAALRGIRDQLDSAFSSVERLFDLLHSQGI